MNKLMKPTFSTAAAAASVLSGWLLAQDVSAAASAPASANAPLSWRLGPGQYRQTIVEVFGPSISITGRFDPEYRQDGLLTIGARTASISASGVERYDELAENIAAQVVDERNRDTLIPCKPASATASDEACARQFLSAAGRLLYRRALTEEEIAASVKLAGIVSQAKHDFYAGLAGALGNMLLSPNFLYVYKTFEPDPEQNGKLRLDGYSKASVLSFFLWNAPPDDALLSAAENGEIHTKKGLRRQVDRMLASPSLENGVRAFFSDMLGFSEFETLAKDPMFFPRFTPRVIDQAQEQTLRTIVDLLVVRQGDYRDLFTTPDTFLTRSLAALYGIPIVDTTDNGQPERWIPYSFPADDPRAGILSHASFVALHSPSGRSSPTDRGKALREYLLCQAVPSPPADVSFAVVQDTNHPVYRTARERLGAHATDAACSGCHKITDPIGLALENFDSAGGFRTTENGAQIDTSGELNGTKFDGPVGLAKALRSDPALTACVATRAVAYASGRTPRRGDAELKRIQAEFADNRYNFVELLREVALSDALFSVPPQATQLVTAR
ncbi:DUF1592 domain-containing protein [Steroidobacter sp. S1-65]|uniref:DUF1592 domain-containing protein n=1 Tax=Steroidobacter gossypii TaxID=2805490 RepID=A0ABS1X0C6_9GAMM|nr:DUF1592 domain-containing protein [Steroidobacter gossypii]MBM0106690.1 DUF1592 domain-containing protein [Steroidobacter gossypii]